MQWVLDSRETIVVAIVVLFVGKWVNFRFSPLRTYNIPEAVTGGLLASTLLALLYVAFDFRLSFDLDLRNELLILFFTTVGLSSRFSTLIQGGRQLLILSVLAVMYLVIQSGIGVSIALATQLDPLIGVIGGSVSLSGGHGTAIAWAEVFKVEYGIDRAGEFGVAAATFGLVLGGVLGGPLSRMLIVKKQLQSDSDSKLSVGVPYEADNDPDPIDYERMLATVLLMGVTVGLGVALDAYLKSLGARLPTFVSCLFAGILITNLAPLLPQNRRLPEPEKSPSLALVADISLGLFLAISLASMELWTLGDLGLPLLLILLAQVAAVLLWSAFVVFRAMGQNYDAAVMAGGYVGLALGATPTAIANMTAVTRLFGPSPRAFIIIPLIGAFFIDLANTLVIQGYLKLLRPGAGLL